MKHLTWVGPLLMAILYVLVQSQSQTLPQQTVPSPTATPTRNIPPWQTAPQTSAPQTPPWQNPTWPQHAPSNSPPTSPRTSGTAGIPQKALDVLDYIRKNGQPMDGYVGGRVFDNREGRLPPGGSYHEYDVDPKIRGEGRDADRLIIDQDTGHAWYTGDHYRTFVQFPD